MPHLTPLPPLDTAPLFPALHADLVTLLRSLDAADWERPTVAGAWRVRDVAAHLLDGDLRKLSAHRDGHLLAPDQPIEGYADVVALIQRLNAGGVSFGARLSPRLLTDLLGVSGRWVSEFVAALDPDATALFPVAWAGEEASDNRFDTAREFTERWHHQMQIRDAIGARGYPAVLLADEYVRPLMETSLRALPHRYRDVAAAEGSSVAVSLSPALSWSLQRVHASWRVYRGHPVQPTATVRASADTMWRLFFNALSAEALRDDVALSGPTELVTPLLQTRAVMV
jgi:hypothetical protein